MKKLLLLLLVLPFLGIAQNDDWHPLPSNQVSYYSFGGRYAPIRIDSIISSDAGDAYYNIRTTEVFLQDEDDGTYYHDPMASWLGNSTLIKEDTAVFKNKHNEELIIPYTRNDDSKWRFYDFQDGKYIEAWFSGKEYYELVEGLFDTVKHLSFQIYNMDGTEFDSPFNDISLMLSKNYGFINFYAWYYFPEEINTYPHIYKSNLKGIEKGEYKYGFEWDFDQIVSKYEVGDIIHVKWGDFENGHSSDYIDEYVNKILTNDYVEYNIKRTYRNFTSLEIYTKRFDFNKFPRQSLWNEDNEFVGLKQYNRRMWQEKNGYELREYTNYSKEEYQGVTYYCREPNSSMSPYPTTTVNEVHTYDQRCGPDGDCANIIYYKNKEEEWGESFPPFNLADYQILRPDISAFYTSGKGIRIDEIENLGYKKMYKSYRNIEPYYYSEGEYYNDPYGSWIGMQTMVYSTGRTVFYNRYYDTIVFEPTFNVGESWIVRVDNDESYIEATIISEDEQLIFPDLMDSVKTIQLVTKDKNGQIIHTNNRDATLKLSKHWGFIDFPIMYSFSKYFWINQLIGVQKNEETYGWEYSYGNIFNSLEVGDVFHYQNVDVPSIETKKELITKNIYNKKVEYVFDVCQQIHEYQPNDTTYVTHSMDTIAFPYNLMPLEIIFDTNIFGTEVYSSFHSNTIELLCDEHNYYDFDLFKKTGERNYGGRIFWNISLFSDFHDLDKNTFVEGIGYYRDFQHDSDRDYDVVDYFSNSLMTCGTPHDFSCHTGIEETDKLGFMIAPNPSNGIFTISNNTSSKADKIMIVNTRGQVVWQQEISEDEQQLNLSSLASGLYLMKVYLKDNQVINKKIMIRK